MMRSGVRLTALALVGVLMTTGCSFIGGGGGGTYKLVAYFPRAVSVYQSSQVKILGLPAGTVDKIEVVGTEVKVTMSIDNSTSRFRRT